MKNLFTLCFLVAIFGSCEKSTVEIGLEGNYIVHISSPNHFSRYSDSGEDTTIHGIVVKPGFPRHPGCFNRPNDGSSSTTLAVFKQQGKYYIEQQVGVVGINEYHEHVPLTLEKGRIKFENPIGQIEKKSRYYLFDIDKETLEGVWIKSYECNQGSVGSISNATMEVATIKLVKE